MKIVTIVQRENEINILTYYIIYMALIYHLFSSINHYHCIWTYRSSAAYWTLRPIYRIKDEINLTKKDCLKWILTNTFLYNKLSKMVSISKLWILIITYKMLYVYRLIRVNTTRCDTAYAFHEVVRTLFISSSYDFSFVISKPRLRTSYIYIG